MIRRTPRSTRCPKTTLFRSINYMKYAFQNNIDFNLSKTAKIGLNLNVQLNNLHGPITASDGGGGVGNIFNAIMQNNAVDFPIDRKSTRLNSSHANISYAVFC